MKPKMEPGKGSKAPGYKGKWGKSKGCRKEIRIKNKK